MWKVAPLALAAACLVPGGVHALEIKNVRAAYGAIGPTRTDNKYQPGDFVLLVFEIDGLKVDQKKLQVSYNLAFDFRDGQKKTLDSKETPTQALMGLGGNSYPGVIGVVIKPDRKPGKHSIKISVTDNYAKQSKSYVYEFEIVPADFAVVGVLAPAILIPGQDYEARFNFVNLALDGKKKPNVEIRIGVLDESGKVVVPAVKKVYPNDLPGGTDLEKANFVPEYYLLKANRPGRFTITIDAHDKIADKKVQLRIPLAVLDLSTFGHSSSIGSR